MIGQIRPLVKAAGKSEWMVASAFHTVAASLSGAALGLVTGAIGEAVGPASPRALFAILILGFVCYVCALRDASWIRRIPILDHERQTPKWWSCTFGIRWASLLWGLDLGQGWTTRVVFSGYFVLLMWVFLFAGPLVGAATLGIFGFARGLPILLAGVNAGGPDAANPIACANGRRQVRMIHAGLLSGLATFLVIGTF